MRDTKVNLCDTCIHTIPTCLNDNIKFGDGLGNDNVIECDGYEREDGTNVK
jgi:hypothetical protein